MSCSAFQFIDLELKKNGSSPRNKEELFNLRHAQLRNVIERIFGVIKRRWQNVRHCCEYNLQTQSLIPLAIAALHNFITFHDPPASPLELPTVRELLVPNTHGDSLPSTGVSPQETARASALRDQIAENMWNDYLQEVLRRGLVHSFTL